MQVRSFRVSPMVPPPNPIASTPWHKLKLYPIQYRVRYWHITVCWAVSCGQESHGQTPHAQRSDLDASGAAIRQGDVRAKVACHRRDALRGGRTTLGAQATGNVLSLQTLRRHCLPRSCQLMPNAHRLVCVGECDSGTTRTPSLKIAPSHRRTSRPNLALQRIHSLGRTEKGDGNDARMAAGVAPPQRCLRGHSSQHLNTARAC